MAVDTRDKRTSILAYWLPFLRPHNPAGSSISQEDWRILVGVYAGLLSIGGAHSSAIGLWLPFLRPWPNPDGTLDVKDRGHILGLYEEVLFSAGSPSSGTSDDGTFFRGMFRQLFRGMR